MPPSEVEKLFRAFAEKREAELPRFTPDGIPITMENKFDDAIYNYLYEYWKTNSGEYDPKDDEIIMTKESSFTKNEKKFEQWLFAQYGMTNKEQREYTFKGNLLSLGEIALSAWGIEGAGATKLVVPGKFLASNADDTAKKALQQDTIEDAVEGTLKKEVAEEVAENTAKKEIADTAEDLSQKTVKKEDSLGDNSGVKRGNEANTIRVGRWMSQAEYDKMIETGKVQMSGDNKVHVANPANIDAFGKQAPKGSIYVEFDVPINTVSTGGTDGWGIINGPGSLLDRLNERKGLPRITEMPNAKNIEIKGSK